MWGPCSVPWLPEGKLAHTEARFESVMTYGDFNFLRLNSEVFSQFTGSKNLNES